MGAAVPNMQSCTQINGWVVVLQGVILGRRCSLQETSQDMCVVRKGEGEESAPVGGGRVQSMTKAATQQTGVPWRNRGAWQC